MIASSRRWAWALGLAGLVGLDPAQREAVAGTLARLGQRGVAQVDAHLTIDARLQAAALSALRTGGRFRAARTASLVVLDADLAEATKTAP